MIPRILIGASQSGSGKTSVTLGLVAALRRRGLRVQTFKVGPDYLDPGWLAVASGRPCYNLDGWMHGRDYVERLFTRASRGADVAVIEGVMGLFDGAAAGGLEGSSAEIAGWLQTPVVLVVNARGMGQSLAALVAGFAGFHTDVRVEGVIANFCGSGKHREILEAALAGPRLPALLGAVPRLGLPQLPSRHLGLVAPDPKGNCAPDVLKEFATGIERYVDLDRVLRVARAAPPLRAVAPDQEPPDSLTRHARILADNPVLVAVARDEAFHFYYQDFFDELTRRGCRFVSFSPLCDPVVPEEADAVIIGGGYPEEFAETLSANDSMLTSVRRFVQSGRPVYAECGGLIYLSRAVTTLNEVRYPLVDILPAETRMLERRRRLGYVEVTLKEPVIWGAAGDRLRGHAFHYSELTSDPTESGQWSAAYDLRARRNLPPEREGFSLRAKETLASYAHLHLAGNGPALDRFLETCLHVRAGRTAADGRE